MPRRSRHISIAALIGLLFAAAACGGSSTKHSSSARHETTTSSTRAPRHYRWPLTGVVTTDSAAATRPALTVKVENIAASRPQIGIDVADVVYEEVVECSITRLAAVFQSHVPDVVGPIRSVRKTDTELVQPLHGIFAFSGGAAYAIASIQTAPVVRLDETTSGAAMFRMAGRGGAPHNLFGRGPALYTRAQGATGPPHALFHFGTPPPAGTFATHATIGFQSQNTVSWDWDRTGHVWRRSFNGAPDSVLGGAPITVRNVVILAVDYTVGQGACNSVGSEAQLQGGSGALTVLRDGHVWRGTWRYDPSTSTVGLYGADGSVLPLTPGNTWVELPKPAYVVAVS